MVKLESRRYGLEEWNIIFGELKARDELAPKGFLLVNQIFKGVVEDGEGKLWRCSGWYGSDPYVSVESYNL